MNFQKGDLVRCIDDTPWANNKYLKNGEIYEVGGSWGDGEDEYVVIFTKLPDNHTVNCKTRRFELVQKTSLDTQRSCGIMQP
jgi:hypothetical protein